MSEVLTVRSFRRLAELTPVVAPEFPHHHTASQLRRPRGSSSGTGERRLPRHTVGWRGKSIYERHTVAHKEKNVDQDRPLNAKCERLHPRPHRTQESPRRYPQKTQRESHPWKSRLQHPRARSQRPEVDQVVQAQRQNAPRRRPL